MNPWSKEEKSNQLRTRQETINFLEEELLESMGTRQEAIN